MTIFGNLLCSSFLQNSGVLNTGGYTITASGSFTITNGTSTTIQGLGTGADSITAASATLKGIPGNLLNLNPASAWKLHVCGPLNADYVNLGYCNASCSTGYANNSAGAGVGTNNNWKFGKFWRGSSGDAQWTTTFNWAPPGAPTASSIMSGGATP